MCRKNSASRWSPNHAWFEAAPASTMLHETPCLDRSLMSFAFNADTLRPSHCTPQPSLPALLRIGHTAEFDAPVLMPLPHDTSLWIAPQDQGENGPALTLTREIAEHWALQMLLQAPADQLELFIYDTGLDASLPTLERICAAAKAKGMTQRVHFITDAASLQTQLELWQTDARQRKSHLLQTGHTDWVQLLKSDSGQPLRLVLFAQLDELVDTAPPCVTSATGATRAASGLLVLVSGRGCAASIHEE